MGLTFRDDRLKKGDADQGSDRVSSPKPRKRKHAASTRSLLLLLGLSEVEVELLAFEDVAVETSALAWTRGDACEQSAGVELGVEVGIDLAVLVPVLQLLLQVLAHLALLSLLAGLLFVKLNIIVLQVPLSERSRVDINNAVLDQSLGAHQFVVGRVVDGVDHTSLACARLRRPREAAMVQAPSAVLHVATTTSDERDLLGTELGQSWHSAHLKLSFFLVNWHAAARGPSLVPGVPGNAHTS
jgi:hypothetical protein